MCDKATRLHSGSGDGSEGCDEVLLRYGIGVLLWLRYRGCDLEDRVAD